MDNLKNNEECKTLRIWINGKKPEFMLKIKINASINSLKRLKDAINYNIKDYKISNIKIYNHKGLEIDNADIDNLLNNQVIYVALDGESFNLINYIYEYEFVKWIKSGGYGKVFYGIQYLTLARNVINNEDYAIKKIDISNLQSEEIYNIYREALYLESFKHKNIIKFYHSFIYDNNFYTVMDLAKGGELSKYINDQKCLSERTAKKLFRQIHQAVAYIHSKSVIHRDLKPNNILFLDDKNENLVIIDFGISGFHSGNIKEIIKAGTTRFIPPELASGHNYISSPKIDIWALGVILYLMMFGVFPFDGTDSEIYSKIIKEEHKFPTSISISKACKNLINGLLEKNSTIRIDIHDKLFEEWYEDTNDEEFVVINSTPIKALNNTPSSLKGRSPGKEGKEFFHKYSVEIPKFDIDKVKKSTFSGVSAFERLSVKNSNLKDKKSLDKTLRKKTLNEKSPSLKRSMEFGFNTINPKKLSEGANLKTSEKRLKR